MVMFDECTDVFNKEQFTFCMQWVNYELEISEKFLGSYKTPDVKSSTIVTSMKSISHKGQLNRDMCKGNFMTVLAISWGNHPVLPLRFLENNQRHLKHTTMFIRHHFR